MSGPEKFHSCPVLLREREVNYDKVPLGMGDGSKNKIFYRIRKGLNYEDANTEAILYGCFCCCVYC
jgi:hypothetical protein